jgi:hypothetical protein
MSSALRRVELRPARSLSRQDLRSRASAASRAARSRSAFTPALNARSSAASSSARVVGSGSGGGAAVLVRCAQQCSQVQLWAWSSTVISFGVAARAAPASVSATLAGGQRRLRLCAARWRLFVARRAVVFGGAARRTSRCAEESRGLRQSAHTPRRPTIASTSAWPSSDSLACHRSSPQPGQTRRCQLTPSIAGGVPSGCCSGLVARVTKPRLPATSDAIFGWRQELLANCETGVVEECGLWVASAP